MCLLGVPCHAKETYSLPRLGDMSPGRGCSKPAKAGSCVASLACLATPRRHVTCHAKEECFLGVDELATRDWGLCCFLGVLSNAKEAWYTRRLGDVSPGRLWLMPALPVKLMLPWRAWARQGDMFALGVSWALMDECNLPQIEEIVVS